MLIDNEKGGVLMTREQLIEALIGAEEYAAVEDQEEAHIWADQVLLEYIGDEEITAYFNDIDKWYA